MMFNKMISTMTPTRFMDKLILRARSVHYIQRNEFSYSAYREVMTSLSNLQDIVKRIVFAICGINALKAVAVGIVDGCYGFGRCCDRRPVNSHCHIRRLCMCEECVHKGAVSVAEIQALMHKTTSSTNHVHLLAHGYLKSVGNEQTKRYAWTHKPVIQNSGGRNGRDATVEGNLRSRLTTTISVDLPDRLRR